MGTYHTLYKISVSDDGRTETFYCPTCKLCYSVTDAPYKKMVYAVGDETAAHIERDPILAVYAEWFESYQERTGEFL